MSREMSEKFGMPKKQVFLVCAAASVSAAAVFFDLRWLIPPPAPQAPPTSDGAAHSDAGNAAETADGNRAAPRPQAPSNASWEEYVDYLIARHFWLEESVFIHDLPPRADAEKAELAAYLKTRYAQLRPSFEAQGRPLSELPHTREFVPLQGITDTIWDPALGKRRAYEPAVQVHLSKVRQIDACPSGACMSYGGAVINVDGERRLSWDEEYRLLTQGAAPADIAKVVYFGKDGKRLPLGARPAPLYDKEAAKERWRQYSDDEWTSALVDFQDKLENMRPAQLELMADAMGAVWRERGDAWRKQIIDLTLLRLNAADDANPPQPQTPSRTPMRGPEINDAPDTEHGAVPSREAPHLHHPKNRSEPHVEPPGHNALDWYLETLKEETGSPLRSRSERERLRRHYEETLRKHQASIDYWENRDKR